MHERSNRDLYLWVATTSVVLGVAMLGISAAAVAAKPPTFHRHWTTTWEAFVAYAFFVLGLGTFIAGVTGVRFPWHRDPAAESVVKPERTSPPAETQEPDREALFSSEPDRGMVLEILRQEWHQRRNYSGQRFMVGAFEVRVVNGTFVRKTIMHTGWEGIGYSLEIGLGPEDSESVRMALQRARDQVLEEWRRFPDAPTVIPPNDSIQGWVSMTFPFPSEQWDPRFRFYVDDELGNRYYVKLALVWQEGLVADEL